MDSESPGIAFEIEGESNSSEFIRFLSNGRFRELIRGNSTWPHGAGSKGVVSPAPKN